MAGVNRLVGAPWHVERFKRQEDDPRRHRFRCKYYNKVTKQCAKRNGKCIGAAHCLEYDESVHQEIKIEDRFIKKDLNFSGIKEIAVETVEIPDKYQAHAPSEAKVNELIAYYHKNGHLDKPIIVLCQNN